MPTPAQTGRRQIDMLYGFHSYQEIPLSTVIDKSTSPDAGEPNNANERQAHRRDSRDKRTSKATPRDTAPTKPAKIRPTKLRIIGGSMRGRGVLYLGDRTTRPMKDSIRETLFNILGKSIKGAIALDLFAGTGVLAIESLSRGATAAVAIERSGFAAKTIRSSADGIGIGDELSVLTGDTFRLAPARIRELVEATSSSPAAHWVVYFCPPYAMWLDAPEKLFELLKTVAEAAPTGSQLVAETDKFFDTSLLPLAGWDIRRKGNVTLSFLET